MVRRTFLGGLVKFTIRLEVEVDIDQLSTGEELLCPESARIPGKGLGCTQTWKTIPDEMMGEIPSSMRVPRLLANIIRSQ